ncbi:MAG: FkbM family methyltransferase [Actinobacteria bacterium]|nr:FkbM family methyltransferase [Actinomycetota bacterium]
MRTGPAERAGNGERVTAALTRAALANHLRAVIDRFAIGLVVDVGAHHGEYAKLMRGLGYGGQIISYEPVASAFEELERASADDDGWSIHHMALGESDGDVEIRVSGSTNFSSSRTLNARGEALFPRARAVGTETVKARRLDGILNQHAAAGTDSPMLLKIDTQGSDLEVLEGASGVLDRVAAVQVEVPFQPIYDGVAGFPETLRALAGLGFGLSGVFPVSADEGLRLIEVDCVAVRLDAPP